MSGAPLTPCGGKHSLMEKAQEAEAEAEAEGNRLVDGGPAYCACFLPTLVWHAMR